jgi:spermidine/putrescine transport system substrate-binding protein
MNDRKPMIPPALLSRSALSRRNMLRGMGLASTAAFLAACGIKGTDSSGDSGSSNPSSSGSSGSSSSSSSSDSSLASAPSVADQSDTDKTVNWSSWPEYLDVSEKDPNDHPSIDQFEKATGIKVTYTEDVNDNDQYFAKIQPLLAAGKSIAADVFVVTDWMVGKLIELGYLEDLDYANIPNKKNLNPALENVSFDPGRKKSITWQSGFAGIAYNPKVTDPIESMDQLLTDPKLKGKVTLLTEMRDTVGLTMLDMGIDCSKFTDAEFDSAIAKLQKAVDAGQIRQFTGNDYAQGLVSGDIAACAAWTGDVVQLQADNSFLKYVLPDKGCTLWSDNFVIPNGCKHKKNAEKLINFYYQPEIAAEVADYVNYISPVQGTKDILVKSDAGVANNPLIFPSDDVMKRAHVFMNLNADQQKRYSAAFAKLMGS